MKATLDHHALLKELRFSTAGLVKNSILPIYGNVKMEFSKDFVTLSTFDGRIYCQSGLECECKKPFTVLVEYSTIIDICKVVYAPITISLSGTDDKPAVNIVSDKAKYNIGCMTDGDLFPEPPNPEFKLEFDAGSEYFEAIKTATGFLNQQYGADYGKNPAIQTVKNKMHIFASDGQRLYKKTLNLPSFKSSLFALIPMQFAIATSGFVEAKISMGDTHAMAESDSRKIFCSMLEQKPPDYESLIIKDAVYNCTFDRNEAVSAIKQACVMGNKTSKYCELQFDDGYVSVISIDSDFEQDGKSSFVANSSVEIGSKIGLNAELIAKLLQAIDGDEISMAYASPQRSLMIYSKEDESVVTIMYPLLLSQ